jgi:D-sedoheptulose 7-phosphate isomerase
MFFKPHTDRRNIESETVKGAGMSWESNVSDIQYCLNALSSTIGITNEEVDREFAFKQWKDWTQIIRRKKKTIYLIGNGASASMASHISADLAKNAFVHTEVFSDLSLLTAVGNDLGYEEVFAEPLRRRMNDGDMLIAISSSGQSPNILRAVKTAISIGGYVITLSGMKPDNILRSLGILNYYVPASTYGLAETSHAAILHHWVDLMTEKTEDPFVSHDIAVGADAAMANVEAVGVL